MNDDAKHAAPGDRFKPCGCLTDGYNWLNTCDVHARLYREARKREISAGGSYEVKLYGTPGLVGTIAGITIFADPEVPEHVILIKDDLGRELGRIVNVGK